MPQDAKDTANGTTMSRAHALKTIHQQIAGIQVAMLTTVDSDGALHSRPMAALDDSNLQSTGELWFFTYADAGKVGDVQHDQQVTLSYVDSGKQRYVSLSGTAQLVRDRS